MSEDDDIKLNARELAIARRAADMAVKQVMEQFYAGVGRTVVKRVLIVIGAIVVGVAVGKGWLSIKDLAP